VLSEKTETKSSRREGGKREFFFPIGNSSFRERGVWKKNEIQKRERAKYQPLKRGNDSAVNGRRDLPDALTQLVKLSSDRGEQQVEGNKSVVDERGSNN